MPIDTNILMRGIGGIGQNRTFQDIDREIRERDRVARQQAMQEQLSALQLQKAKQNLMKPEQLQMEQLLAKSIQLGGVQNLSPSERSQLQAFDIAQRTKQNVDARGNIITNRSIFDVPLSGGNEMPDSAFDNSPMSGDYSSQGLTSQTAPPALPYDPMSMGFGDVSTAYPVNEDALPIAPTESSVMQGINTPVSPATEQAAQEAVVKINTEKIIERFKRGALKEQDLIETIKSDQNSINILRDMIAYNDKTLDIPYVQYAQTGARFFNPEAAKSLDLLAQNRLELATPLAKQLGVNPTDKDFQAQLDRIVNLSGDKASRAAQLNNIIKRIGGKTEDPLGIR